MTQIRRKLEQKTKGSPIKGLVKRKNTIPVQNFRQASGTGAALGGIAVGLTTWGVGAPVGAAAGSALLGTAATALMGGDITDQVNSAIGGVIGGVLGGAVSNLMISVSKNSVQAAVRAGIMTGLIDAILLQSDPVFADTGKQSDPCK